MSSVFHWPVRVYWEDTDAGGIVFYANYLKFFERARTEWLRSLGLGQQRLLQEWGGMFVVSETALRYLQPARLDDVLQVSARVTALGRSSASLQQEARKLATQGAADSTNSTSTRVAGSVAASVAGSPVGSGAELLCSASIRIAWVEAASLRPARMPAVLQHLLNQT